MRRLLAPVGSVMASVAFQFSVAFYPEQLRDYAFLLPYLWAASILCWAAWIVTHPWVKTHVWHLQHPAMNVASASVLSVPNDAAERENSVQYVGFETQGDEPTGALLCFQLVLVPGEPVKDFPDAHLKIDYYQKTDEKIIAEVFPAVWWDSGKGTVDIGHRKQRAMIASYFQGKWTANEVVEIPMYLDSEIEEADSLSKTEFKATELPFGEIKIIATIIGRRNLSLRAVSGILTLGKDGSASFARAS